MMNKWHLISSLVFMCCFIATRLMTGPVAELFVLIAILFFLPAILAFFVKEERESKPGILLGFLMKAFPLAALCATAAFIYHSALFASGWFLYTILLALYGFTRLLKRGIFPLHELIIDGAWMYLALGGALVLAVHGRYTGDDLFTNHRAFDRYSFSLLSFFYPAFLWIIRETARKRDSFIQSGRLGDFAVACDDCCWD